MVEIDDISTIALCAKLSNEAYTQKLKSVTSPGKLLVDLKTDCHIHIASQNNIIYVVSRGSSSITDALHDIKMWRSKCEFLKNTKIHTGFLDQYMSIRRSLQSQVNLLLNDNINTIVFTGHSLGGALSTIGALDYKIKQSNLIVKCITFASPRVGSPDFAKLFNESIDVSKRFVFHRDPVTFVPICLRFRHVKGCIHLKKDNTVNVSEEYFFPIGCLVSQHFMEKYKQRILELNNYKLSD